MILRQSRARTVLAIVRAPLFVWIALLDFNASAALVLRIIFVVAAVFFAYAGVRSIWGGVVLLDDRMIVRGELWTRTIPLSAIDDVRGDASVVWHTASGTARRTRLIMFRRWWLGGASDAAYNDAAMMRIAAWVDARDLAPSSEPSGADQAVGGRQTSV